MADITTFPNAIAAMNDPTPNHVDGFRYIEVNSPINIGAAVIDNPILKLSGTGVITVTAATGYRITHMGACIRRVASVDGVTFRASFTSHSRYGFGISQPASDPLNGEVVGTYRNVTFELRVVVGLPTGSRYDVGGLNVVDMGTPGTPEFRQHPFFLFQDHSGLVFEDCDFKFGINGEQRGATFRRCHIGPQQVFAHDQLWASNTLFEDCDFDTRNHPYNCLKATTWLQDTSVELNTFRRCSFIGGAEEMVGVDGSTIVVYPLTVAGVGDSSLVIDQDIWAGSRPLLPRSSLAALEAGRMLEGHHLLVSGGDGFGEYFRIERYDPATRTFTLTPGRETPRGIAAVSPGDTVEVHRLFVDNTFEDCVFNVGAGWADYGEGCNIAVSLWGGALGNVFRGCDARWSDDAWSPAVAPSGVTAPSRWSVGYNFMGVARFGVEQNYDGVWSVPRSYSGWTWHNKLIDCESHDLQVHYEGGGYYVGWEHPTKTHEVEFGGEQFFTVPFVDGCYRFKSPTDEQWCYGNAVVNNRSYGLTVDGEQPRSYARDEAAFVWGGNNHDLVTAYADDVHAGQPVGWIPWRDVGDPARENVKYYPLRTYGPGLIAGYSTFKDMGLTSVTQLPNYAIEFQPKLPPVNGENAMWGVESSTTLAEFDPDEYLSTYDFDVLLTADQDEPDTLPEFDFDVLLLADPVDPLPEYDFDVVLLADPVELPEYDFDIVLALDRIGSPRRRLAVIDPFTPTRL